ncbi:hypothetical protein ACOMHN_057065 [Nucella lapillus]
MERSAQSSVKDISGERSATFSVKVSVKEHLQGKAVLCQGHPWGKVSHFLCERTPSGNGSPLSRSSSSIVKGHLQGKDISGERSATFSVKEHLQGKAQSSVKVILGERSANSSVMV